MSVSKRLYARALASVLLSLALVIQLTEFDRLLPQRHSFRHSIAYAQQAGAYAQQAGGPSNGRPRPIPGTIQAEDYDTGGEGLAYHDVDATNLGGQYRTDGVDIKVSADRGGGYTVGWFEGGEWLAYRVNVAQTGKYYIHVRVGSVWPGRTFRIRFDGVETTGPIAVPVMPGWNQYQTVTIPAVTLTAGVQVMSVIMDPLAGMDLNWIYVGASQTAPYYGTPQTLPGRIEAEDYDTGGEDVAYHDIEASNLGGTYRNDGVDIKASADAGGGYAVGWFEATEWLAYTVNIAQTGKYDIQIRAGSALPGRTFRIFFNGADKTGPIAIPMVPWWDQYETVTVSGVELNAGIQVMQVVMGADAGMDLNWVSVQRTTSGPITATAGQVIRGLRIASTTGPCITIHNVANVWVDGVELGPCAGNGVRITGAATTGIRITNSFIHTERAGPNDSGVGVYIHHAKDILIQGNTFSYNESSVYALDASNIHVIGNYSLNPLGPFPRGQHVQFNKVAGGEITENYGETRTTNVQYQPRQEDAINSYQSQDILIARNYMVGGSSPSGCGIIVGDVGGNGNIVEDNILIRTAQCGIGVAGGNNHTVRRNKILDTNIPGGSGNVGIYVWDYANVGWCYGHTISNNIVSNRLPNGAHNDYWNGGNCGTVSFAGNAFGDLARGQLIPEATKLPVPSIPPNPYSISTFPYRGTPWAIPGRVQAEDYDSGGEGVAYHDIDSSNLGGAYRGEGVDIKQTNDAGGGYTVGWVRPGEWLAYTVYVALAGKYDIQIRVGSPWAGRTFHISFDGVDRTGPIVVPPVPDWDQYQTVTISGVPLRAGIQVMRILMGVDDGMDLNWVNIMATPLSGLSPAATSKVRTDAHSTTNTIYTNGHTRGYTSSGNPEPRYVGGSYRCELSSQLPLGVCRQERSSRIRRPVQRYRPNSEISRR